MRINSNADYLALVRHALETDIAPQLESSAAQYKLELVKNVIVELQRRETGAAENLRETIGQGRRLCRDIQNVLGDDHGKPTAALPEKLGFADLCAIHEELTAELERLCRRVVRSSLVAERRLALLREVAEWELSYYAREGEISLPEPAALPDHGKPLSLELMQEFLNSDASDIAGPVEVTELVALTGGFGKQTFLCRYRDAGQLEQQLVVRKSDPMPIMQHGTCMLDNEYALLLALAPTDYPAPRPIDFVPAGWGGVDGAFYTVKPSAGEVPGEFLGGAKSALPEGLLLHLAELLGKLHSTPLSVFADYARQFDNPQILQGTVRDTYRSNLMRWEAYIAEQEHLSSPYLIWLLDWLKENLPESTAAPVLIHGDFNIHNVLAENQRISVVLDWECAEFGAPEQDLGYIRPHISQHIDWQRFVDHYLAHGGREPDEKLMAYGMAYAAVRTNLAGNRGTMNLQKGRNRDLRYAMVELGFTPSFMKLALDSTR